MITKVMLTLLILWVLDTMVTCLFSVLMQLKCKKRFSLSNREGKVEVTQNNGGGDQNFIYKRVIRIYMGWIRYKLILLGKLPCHFIRLFILRHVYRMKIAPKVVIYGGFEIRDPWNISIGRGTIIGDESKLDGRNGITIGDNVNFSTGVWIWTSQHDLNDPLFATNEKGGRVIIRDRVWVSTRTIILPKVIIDEGVVIAAGAVVTHNCQAFTVYGGVPAKRIGDRNRNLAYEYKGSHTPFF